MSTIIIKKEINGISFQKDGGVKYSIFTSPTRLYPSGTKIILRFGGDRFDFVEEDDITINDASFSGTAVQICDKLRDEVFFLDSGEGSATTDASLLTSGTLSDDRLSVKIKAKEADYIIEKIGTIFHAHPRTGLTAYSGTDAYTVIQSAITALTTPGARGTAGGKIYITRGTYNLTNELIITGWEGQVSNPPYSQLVIEGDGKSTRILQGTTGKSGIIVKNNASISLSRMYIECTNSNARSALRLEADGANSEISVFGGVLDDLYLTSYSSTYPALYMANFFDLNVGTITCNNSIGDGIIIHNESATTLYGNSNFNFVRSVASNSAGFSGLKFTSNNGASWKCINLLSFNNYECVSGYYGVNIVDGSNIVFGFIDIEYGTYGFYGGIGTLCRNNKVLGGLISASNTSIHMGANAGGNYFACELGGSGTTKPINDLQQFIPGNSYDVVLTSTLSTANISVTNPFNTVLQWRGGTNGETKFSHTKLIRAQTGTTYTLGKSDNNAILTLSNAAAITLTIQTNANTFLGTNYTTTIIQKGAGQITISPQAGVTINSKGGALKSNGQYATMTLVKESADVWYLYGDITV